MMTNNTTSSSGKWVRGILVTAGFGVVVVVMLLYLAGVFHPKVEQGGGGAEASAVAGRPVAGAKMVAARVIRVPRSEAAVGTVQSVHETSVASKLLAKVVDVNVKAGQAVRMGEVLVRLDDADLKARFEQAQSAARAARAQRDQAKIEYDRVEGLLKKQAAARIEFDRVRNAYDAAEANLKRAEQAITEAQTILDYATIHSPLDGIVIDKQVDVGDMVTPGQVLLRLYDPTRMQLVASVRESLTRRLKVGQKIPVEVEALGHACQGLVSEIVPEAQSASRTFSVKVTGPCPPGVYSGMFGRLLIPLDDEEVLVIPAASVERVGQLELVYIAQDDRMQRRAIKLGRTFGSDVEVLSGVRAGEQVAVLGRAAQN